MQNIRNIAIIAHVDHGKTTLVDALLRQTHTKLNKEQEGEKLIMDSNELERERGITIFSKNASVIYKDTKINIIDTPGHADFGGEVERVLNMADGCLLLVDAKDGPKPQTRFVLKQALKMGLKIIVVINKIDKPDARPQWVIDKTFDLFVELGADESAAFFPIIYASGRDGKAGMEADIAKMTDITPLFELILSEVPEPKVDPDKPFQFLVTSIRGDNFKGRIATGKIYSGRVKAGEEIVHINREGVAKPSRVTALLTYQGLDRVEVTEAQAGDLVAIAGTLDVNIGETLADKDSPVALPVLSIEEPTVRMTFRANTSPFGGLEGKFKTSQQIKARLYKELETDLALKVLEDGKGGWIVSGRGELHLAILIERLRREGYELEVSRPEAIIKMVDGVKMTPFEKLYVEVPEEFSGAVIQKMNIRHAAMTDMYTEAGITYLEFDIATKELVGYRNEFLTDTKGLGILNSVFDAFKPDTTPTHKRDHGSLVAHETGETRLYGLTNIQDRGELFVGPAERVYKGQVVGKNSRSEDISVNVCKEKKLSNMRSKGDGAMEHFNAPKRMNLEEALEYIDDSELVEVTPESVRIRKAILDEKDAKRAAALNRL